MAALSCRDDGLVQALNALGYNPILLPRTGVVAPDLYIYDNDDLKRWGRLAACVPTGALPATLNEGELPDIQRKQTSKKNAQAGGSFLKNALASIGVVGAPKLDLSFARDRAVTFSFSGVTYKGLDPGDISAALAQFDPGAIPSQQIAAGMLHVAYEYAYASSLLLSVVDAASAGVDFKALEISNFIDLGGKAAIATVDSATLAFSGHAAAPAAFACKVGRLERHGKRWEFFADEVVGQGLVADESAAPTPYLLYKGAVLQAEDAAAAV